MDIQDTIKKDVTAALQEDVGEGDWTALLTDENQQSEARILSRSRAVIAGSAWFDAVFKQLDPNAYIQWSVHDGQSVAPNTQLCKISGKTRALLTGERTALNFLQSLSAVATRTAEYVTAVQGTRAKILDTRKTLPGLRLAQKYAVKAGGGVNHRIGLYDGVLIKENHIAALGGVRAALMKARQLAPTGMMIQIEVETLSQLDEALECGAKLILLDNMGLEALRHAVQRTNGQAELEASGGITMSNVRDIALTGVDRISIGALTKDIQSIDLSMRF